MIQLCGVVPCQGIICITLPVHLLHKKLHLLLSYVILLCSYVKYMAHICSIKLLLYGRRETFIREQSPRAGKITPASPLLPHTQCILYQRPASEIFSEAVCTMYILLSTITLYHWNVHIVLYSTTTFMYSTQYSNFPGQTLMLYIMTHQEVFLFLTIYQIFQSTVLTNHIIITRICD